MLRIFTRIAALLLVIEAVVPDQPSRAQTRPLFEIACAGRIAGAAFEGPVRVALPAWSPDTPEGRAARAEELRVWLARGRLGAVPGHLVHLEGRLASADAGVLRFEIFLHGGTKGDGSIWYSGRRERERFMRVELRAGALAFTLEGGGAGRLDCGAGRASAS